MTQRHFLLVSVGLCWIASTAIAAEPNSQGPSITYFGIARQQDHGVVALQPNTQLVDGTVVFSAPSGSGFYLIVEAKSGASKSLPGAKLATTSSQPDLEVIADTPFGDGSLTVCDANSGGVPAVPLLMFSENSSVLNAIRDLACRFTTGVPITTGGYVRSDSQRQYALLMNSRTVLDPLGMAATLAVRVRDLKGHWGQPQRMKLIIADHRLNPDGRKVRSRPVLPVGIASTEVSAALAVQPPAVVSVDLHVLVAIANFKDTAPLTLSRTQVQQAMDRVRDYYAENSYGNIQFHGVIDPTQSVDVVGGNPSPISLPIAQTCNLESVGRAAIDQVDPRVNFQGYAGIIVIAPFEPCPWQGQGLPAATLSTQDGSVSLFQVAIEGETNQISNWWALIAHEVGHTFLDPRSGGGHAGFLDCSSRPVASSTCTQEELLDFYDIIGGFLKGHFNAVHKELLGWFQPSNLQTVTSSGTYLLEPLALNTTHLKALKIPRDPGNPYPFWYVEYRQPIGQDANLDGNVYDGALIHVNSSTNTSWLIDPTQTGDLHQDVFNAALVVGETLTDPVTGTRISAISQDSNGLTVGVQLGRTDFRDPQVAIEAPLSGSILSGNATVRATATDASGIEKIEFAWGGMSGLHVFATTTIAPYEATLDTTLLPNGEIHLNAKAYDSSGAPFGVSGNSSVAQPVFVVVKNAGSMPPGVLLTAPIAGAMLPSGVPFTVISEPVGGLVVQRMEFYKDSESVPFFTGSLQWTGTLPNGPHTVYARGYDTQNNSYTSLTVPFTVGQEAPGPTDTQPPQIRDVTFSNVTTNSATIEWTTDKDADSQVDYGPSASYGSSASSSALITNHHITLTIDLNAGTLYHYRVTSKDKTGKIGRSGDLTFMTAVANQPPTNQAPTSVTITATPPTITLPVNTVTLTGSATDDGLLGPLSYAWSQTAGPMGGVRFTDATAATTTATFSASGTYTVHLRVWDGALPASQDVTVVVNPAAPQPSGELACTVQAWNSGPPAGPGVVITSIPVGKTFYVSASGGYGMYHWSIPRANPPSFVGTTGTVRFSSGATGVISVTSGASTAHCDISVGNTTTPPPQPPMGNNQPPTSLAATATPSTLTLPANMMVTLSGSATDDGLPGPLKYRWSQVRIPGGGSVMFSPMQPSPTPSQPNPGLSSANATATLSSVAGVYVLRLTATDGVFSIAQDITITVAAAVPVPVPTSCSGALGFTLSPMTPSTSCRYGYLGTVTNGLPTNRSYAWQWGGAGIRMSTRCSGTSKCAFCFPRGGAAYSVKVSQGSSSGTCSVQVP